MTNNDRNSTAPLGASDSVSSRFYEQEVDALRFIACLGVFLCHALPKLKDMCDDGSCEKYVFYIKEIADTLSLGLPLFFFISSYLISRIILIEFRRFESINFSHFLIRRILRIWPLYFLAIGFAATYDQIFTGGIKLKALLFFSIFTGNIYDGFHGFSGGLAGHLWSISSEEQFYVLMSVLLLIFGVDRLRSIGRVLIAASACYLVFAGLHHLDPMNVWVNPGSSLVLFGTGILTACYRDKVNTDGRKKKKFRLILATSLIPFAIAKPLSSTQFMLDYGLQHLVFYLTVSAGCAIALVALCESDFLIPRIVRYLGKISFGIYVFHWPILIFYDKIEAEISPWFRVALIIPVIGVAALSYSYVEKPFLRMRSRFTRVPTVTA